MPVRERWSTSSAYLGRAAEGKRYPYRVGKVVGGSSAVNGAIALRGIAADFDAWAAAGNDQWTWDKVLPWYARIEADADCRGNGHGTDGPVPVRRPREGELDRAALGFLRACQAIGLPETADMNGDGVGVGAGAVPSNRVGCRRMSTADTHLAIRPAGLTVWDRCLVSRVLVSRGRVTGLEVLHGGQPRRLACENVVLSAGAIGTPLILQRSGIGDGRELTALGIKTAADLPGVGRNLTDHPAVVIWMPARGVPGARGPGRPSSLSPQVSLSHQVMARLPGLLVFLASQVSTSAVPVVGSVMRGRPGVALSAVVAAPSSRGSVRLRDASPGVTPEILLGLAADPADTSRLMEGARLAWSLVRSGQLSGATERPLVWTDRLMGDDALLRGAVTRFACPLWHPVGTARMGAAIDPDAVVDQRLRVYGVGGLRIADASVMPSIPSAPTNLTCIMIAERAAAWTS